jgi:ATP-dependent RNA helicase DeaD
VEQDVKDSAGVSRSQNVVYVMPHDWASSSHFLEPLVVRVDPAIPAPQLLIVTADADGAAALAAAAVRLADLRTLGIVAATSAPRASRLIKAGPAQIVVGTTDTLLELVRSSTLKLDQVRGLALAWVDEILGAGQTQSLDTLLADVPKEAARTIVTANATPAVEELIERYARRARRVVASRTGEITPIPVQYVSVSAFGRAAALRRVLDELNPDSAAVYVRTDESNEVVADLLRALGYDGPDASVRITRSDAGLAHLIVLYDLPASHEELREAVGAASRRVVALVQPRQLTSLRALTEGGSVTPVTLSEAGGRARDSNEATRRALREILESEQFGRELLTVEPLLEAYDGIEIAAAALKLLERERSTPAQATEARSVSIGGSPANAVRVFLSIGARDGVRPADVVGAITNVCGVAGSEIGRVEIRESHTIVEVAPAVAETIIATLTGTEIRDRRVIARLDQERSARPASSVMDRRPSKSPPGRGRPDRDAASGGQAADDRPRQDRPRNDRPRPDRPRSDRPRSDRPRSDRPRDDRPRGDGPRREDRE